MKVLLTGSSGFIGSNLASFLHLHGCDIYRLVRQKNLVSHYNFFWDPKQGILEAWQLEGFDAIIHLAGENIQSWRWTEAKKKELWDSRILSTNLLCGAAAGCADPPKRILCASAIGYYGETGETVVDESAAAGQGFLAELCQHWEAATQPLKAAHIPVSFLRFGVVLNAQGGALQKMLWPFSLGLGAKLGQGEQYMSWIALEDILHMVLFLLQNTPVEGPLNVVAPKAVTNAEFTKTLAQVLCRPSFLTVPASLIRGLFGQMGEDVLLRSVRAYPKKVLDLGYKFLYSNLKEALQMILQK